MVEAARHASRTHPHWQAERARLEPRLGPPKTIVAIARKLLVAVWHVLTREEADRYADPAREACSLFAQVYMRGVARLPEGQSALVYTREQLDRLKLGRELTHLPWGSKRFRLPPANLAN